MGPLLLKELNYYIKNYKEIIVISFVFLFIILLISFAFPAGDGVPTATARATLWIALFCAVQLAAGQNWQRHVENGELEVFQLLPWLLEWTVLGKICALALAVLLPMALVFPLLALWLGLSVTHWPTIMAGLTAGGMALAALNQLAAGLLAGQQRAGALLGIITLPFAVPVMIFGVSYTAQAALWHPHLAFLLGYGIFLMLFAALAVSAAIRAGN